jgi:hypothetical protein
MLWHFEIKRDFILQDNNINNYIIIIIIIIYRHTK